MNTGWNLWVVGFEDAARAENARDVLLSLQSRNLFLLPDIVLVARDAGGTFTVDRKDLSAGGAISGSGVVGFLVGLVLTQPLLGAAVGASLGAAGVAATRRGGIDDAFIREVGDLIKPGTAALFLLSNVIYRDVLAHNLRGLGGQVLKTNVSPELAEEVQSLLDSAKAAPPKL